jgi:hypothetical protein
LEDGPVSRNGILNYARMAALAEERILELLDKSLRDDLAEPRSKVDLQKCAQPRQGSSSSGQLNAHYPA